eukprot:TRINITY_DN5589_c0_g1_i13.p1 TRINITY_DN5589_c0_g1~~TRINITY_DN5589_c0_g1_i13.p1  ORF type:complete len:145 (-),score=19.54 TRINITY_DN5589_c0_g1_i13:99-533(-)
MNTVYCGLYFLPFSPFSSKELQSITIKMIPENGISGFQLSEGVYEIVFVIGYPHFSALIIDKRFYQTNKQLIILHHFKLYSEQNVLELFKKKLKQLKCDINDYIAASLLTKIINFPFFPNKQATNLLSPFLILSYPFVINFSRS